MNWNVNGLKKKENNNLKAWKHFDRLLGICQNPSQTLTNIAKEW